MSTLCVFRVIDSCCNGCRSTATKALKKAYGVSVAFDMAEAKLIVEGGDVDPAKIIEELQRKAKKVKVELVDGPRTVSTASRDEGQIVNERGDDGKGKKIRGFFGRLKGTGSRKGGNQNAGGEGSSSQNVGGFGGGSNADNAGGGGGGSNADGAIEGSREEVNTSRNSSSSSEEEIQEETQGGNRGQTVPMDQYMHNYNHPGQYRPDVPVYQSRPGYDVHPHYNPNGGYPHQPIYNMPQYDNMHGGYPQQPMYNMPPYGNSYGGYPQQPVDHYFSDENLNGCSIT